MSSIAHLSPAGPLFFDPAQFDLDRPGHLAVVSGLKPVVLEGDEAQAFLHWAAGRWKSAFERDLQKLCRHESWGDLLTTTLPLVSFREHYCTMALADDPEGSALLGRLRDETRGWREAGVDTVIISGAEDSKP